MTHPILSRAAITAVLLAATTLSAAAADCCIGPKGGESRKFVVENARQEQSVTAYAKYYQAWMVATCVDNTKSMPRLDVSSNPTGNQRITADVDPRDNIGPKGGSTYRRL